MVVTDSVPEAALVYDLDGTLVRLAVDWKGAQRALRHLVGEAGLLEPNRDAGVWALYELAESNGILEAAEARLAEFEREGAREAVRLPAADRLADLSMPVGVCSLNCEAACWIALETHDLADHVDVVVGRDSVAERKPHPEPLLAAVRGLGTTPEETRFVGDSRSDAVCADRAGTRFSYVDGRSSES